MKIILLSGGSGQRLWPLSNNGRSKQFLKLLKNEYNNEMESMFQRTCRKLRDLDLLKEVYISTNYSQVDILKSQMESNNIPLIIEPDKRDTFPAISLAATYLYSIENISKDETVVVCPVDSFTENSFYRKLSKLNMLISEFNADIALLGVNPIYPSSKYGYMIPLGEGTTDEYMKINYFREKPTESEASRLINQNAKWNCGVFAFKLGYIIDFLNQCGYTSDFNSLISNYDQLPKNSFDYEVVEKATNIMAVEYEGFWKDLGTWNTLTEEMSTTIIGNATMSEDCVNTHIINELNIPVKGLALKNLVVTASPNGILVADKNESHRLKELVGGETQCKNQDQQDWFKILDFVKKENGKEILTKKLKIDAGKSLSYRYPFNRSIVWTFISGEAEFFLNEVKMRVSSGDVIEIDSFHRHLLKTLTDTEIIEVQMGRDILKDNLLEFEFNVIKA